MKTALDHTLTGLAATATLLVLLSGCLDGRGNNTSETHFLSPCLTSADCATRYACLCGLCLLPCDTAARCASDVPAGEVQAPNDPSTLACAPLANPAVAQVCVLEPTAQPSACLPTCREAADCGSGSDGAHLVCVNGLCVNDRRVAFPDHDAGADGDAPPLGGDENNAPEQAVPVEVGDVMVDWLTLSPNLRPTLPPGTGELGRLDPAENPSGDFDRDYYRFALLETSWLAVVTVTDEALTGDLDTVLALRTSDGTPVAVDDDAVPLPQVRERRPGSELIVRLDPGAYVVEVADAAEQSGGQVGARPGEYRLAVGQFFDPSPPNVLIAAERGDDLMSAVDVGVFEVVLLLGTLEGAGDVDVYRFEAAGGATMLEAIAMPPGPDGFGGTPIRMWVTRDWSEAPVATVDGPRDTLWTPVADSAAYLLWVAHDGTAGPAEGHYAIKVHRGEEVGTRERDDEANDALAGAEALDDFEHSLGDLGDGDVDYFAFEVQEGRPPSGVSCLSRALGSGVVDLHVELRDASDQPLGSNATEGSDGAARLDWPATAPLEPGATYLRVSKGDQDPGIGGTSYRCWLHVP